MADVNAGRIREIEWAEKLIQEQEEIVSGIKDQLKEAKEELQERIHQLRVLSRADGQSRLDFGDEEDE